MANSNTPRGFQTDRLLRVNRYYKSASVQLGIGDPVIRAADSGDPQGYAAVTRATTGAAITGVVVGIEPKSTRTTQYMASGDSGYVLVADHPDQEYIVQDNGGATGIAIIDLGGHINSVTALNCNTSTGYSNYTIDTEAKSTGNTWMLVRKLDQPGNDVGAYAKWVVKANLHSEVNASATNTTAI